MSEEKIITEKEVHTNNTLAMPVQTDTKLKEILVEYVVLSKFIIFNYHPFTLNFLCFLI